MSTRTAQFDLRGKVVAITGGARGIGLALWALGDTPSRMAGYYGVSVNRRRTSSACRCVSVLSKTCCR